MFSQKARKIFSIPQPDNHNCTNCGNIFRAKDHFPKHVESLHCVALVLPVSCVATSRGATAKLANTYSAASQWFCNGSVYTEPSEIHADGSVSVLYGSVMVLSINTEHVLYTEPAGSTAPISCRD